MLCIWGVCTRQCACPHVQASVIIRCFYHTPLSTLRPGFTVGIEYPESACLPLWYCGYICLLWYLLFCVGDLNSGPFYACAARTLLVEPSSHYIQILDLNTHRYLTVYYADLEKQVTQESDEGALWNRPPALGEPCCSTPHCLKPVSFISIKGLWGTILAT